MGEKQDQQPEGASLPGQVSPIAAHSPAGSVRQAQPVQLPDVRGTHFPTPGVPQVCVPT